MCLIENEEFVETFGPDRSDPPLRDSVRVGSAKGRVDDMRLLRHKDRIEALGELGIVVVDQEMKVRKAAFEVPDNLARLLVNPGSVWMLGTAGEVDTPAAQLDEEKHIQRLEEERFDREKSHARIWSQ